MASVVWWEIETVSPERFQEFHAALFGWEFIRAFADSGLDADYWLIRDGGTGIGGLQRANDNAPTPSVGTRIYFEADDLEATMARAVELGGTVERERTELGGDDRWFGIIRDPVGISFGLWTEHPACT